MINKPLLPPRGGYVEVVDEHGNHIYKPTQETQEKLNQVKQLASLNTQTTDLQMALCEQYENSDKQLTDLQMALCEVYELIQGGTT